MLMLSLTEEESAGADSSTAPIEHIPACSCLVAAYPLFLGILAPIEHLNYSCLKQTACGRWQIQVWKKEGLHLSGFVPFRTTTQPALLLTADLHH